MLRLNTCFAAFCSCVCVFDVFEAFHGGNLIVSVAVLQISAGFQQVKLGERGGRRRDFHDSGVNTRQLMEHVMKSKTGLC